MRDISLSFYERICVWSMVGNHQVPRLKEAAVLLRIIDKVRPTDIELTETQFVVSGNQMSWQAPDANYGARQIGLEEEEAAALAGVMEAIDSPVRVRDAEWMCRLVESLREKTDGRIEDQYTDQTT